MSEQRFYWWHHLMLRVISVSILLMIITLLGVHIYLGQVTLVHVYGELMLCLLGCVYFLLIWTKAYRSIIERYRLLIYAFFAVAIPLNQFLYGHMAVFLIVLFSQAIWFLLVVFIERYRSYIIDNNTFCDMRYMSDAYALHQMCFDDAGKPCNYTFLKVNDAFEAMTGLKRQQVLGKKILDVLPNTESYWIHFYGDVVAKKAEKSTVQYASALKRYYRVQAYPVDTDCFVAIFQDITKQIISEKKLKLAGDASKKANESKTQFLKDVDHRLRNPLNGMMGMAQIIDFHGDIDENEQLMDAMLGEMKHMRNILDQMSAFILLEDYRSEAVRSNVLSDLHRIFETLEAVPKIQCDIDPLLLDAMVYDVKAFETVMTKLLTNAYKFTRHQEVTLSIILKTQETNQGLLYLAVKDQGLGIALDEQEKLFNEFYHHDFIHVHKSKNHQTLGLLRRLARKIGGDLCVESYADKGSKFTYIMPVKIMTNTVEK